VSPSCLFERADDEIANLRTTQSIVIGDHALTDWPDSSLVLEIRPDTAETRQLRNIPIDAKNTGTTYRPGRPLSSSAPDIQLRVRIAAALDAWYVGFDVEDDSVVPASLTNDSLTDDVYTGDSVEIFLAAASFDSARDYSYEVTEADTSSLHRGAYFQLAFPPKPLADPRNYFQPHRTSELLITRALQHGFAVDIWSSGDRAWSGEARIPIEAFDQDVQNCINGRNVVRMAIDYLDYDEDSIVYRASNCGQNGYCPDNVFGLALDHRELTYPAFMRSAILR
jgi:hypothetical protein